MVRADGSFVSDTVQSQLCRNWVGDACRPRASDVVVLVGVVARSGAAARCAAGSATGLEVQRAGVPRCDESVRVLDFQERAYGYRLFNRSY